MYVKHKFTKDILLIEVETSEGHDFIEIPRDMFLEWLGLKGLVEQYELANRTAEML